MVAPNIFLLQTDGTALAVIDDFLQWEVTERYYTSSLFSLRMDLSANGADLIEKGMFVWEQNADEAFLIEQREMETDEEGNLTDVLSVKGRVAGHLSERVVLPPAGSAYDSQRGIAGETAMKHYVENHAGPSAAAARQVPGLTVAADLGRGNVITVEGRFQYLSEIISNIGTLSGLGWTVLYDSTTNTFQFETLEGTDRTSTVFFDPDFEAIKSQRFLDTDVGRKTWALVAGQGEGVERRTLESWEGTEPTGYNRREMFVDARDLDDAAADAGALADRGQEKLLEATPDSVFEIDAEAFGSFVYGEHWFLGDMVTARNRKWGVSKVVRVVGLKRTYSPEGEDVTVELDRPWPTLKDRVQETMSTGTVGSAGAVDYPRPVPVGSLQMWAGNEAVLPQGWLLCDGAAVSRDTYGPLFEAIGTAYGAGDGSTTFNVPDMRGRFPIGTGTLGSDTYARGATGGEARVALSAAEMPAHTHSGPSHTHSGPNHRHVVDPPNTNTTTDTHNHGSTGGGGTHDHAGRFRYFSQGTGTVNFWTAVRAGDTAGTDGTAIITEGSYGNHSHSTGNDSHAHSVNIGAFWSDYNGTGQTGAAGTGATGSTGSGNAHENRPPYAAVNFLIKT